MTASSLTDFEKQKIRAYSVAEEVTHTLTHGLGAILSIVALVFVVTKASDTGHKAISAAAIYAGCMIVLYVCSTLYHGAYKSTFQPFFETLDHAAIYLMIAGSYTPFALLILPPGKGLAVMIAVWTIAALGVTLKFVAHYADGNHEKFDKISLFGYLGMGWIGLFFIGDLWIGLPTSGFIWLVAGGLCFTVGAAFYAWKQLKYGHAVWHGFVLAGSGCHFVTVYGFVLP